MLWIVKRVENLFALTRRWVSNLDHENDLCLGSKFFKPHNGCCMNPHSFPQIVARPTVGRRWHLPLTALWVSLIIGTLAPVFADGIAVKDVLVPAAPESVRIGGRLGGKMELCVEHRLLAQDIGAVVAPYQTKTETGSGDWRCEYWGKWFTSLALADAYHSTPATRELRDEAAKELMATAAPDGYLGTRTPEHRLEGWDVWGCKYALLGLIADYDRTHDAAVP